MPTKKHVIISVISDLVTDQRVHRTALTLHEAGYEVLLIGRKYRSSLALAQRPYRTKRINPLFRKNIGLYAGFNIYLFCYLLIHRRSILIANDLDTLPANFLVSRIKQTALVYDSHEYFTEVPELQDRPRIKKVWLAIEKYIFPKLKYVITVNQSIADIYYKKYGVNVAVVRNIPITDESQLELPREISLPPDKHIIIYQGAGINIGRAAEETILAMHYLGDSYHLVMIGGGDIFGHLKHLAKENQLKNIQFINKVPFPLLRAITEKADLGLVFTKAICLNYYYSLPNKLFDYLYAGLPVLADKLPEIEKIIDHYDVGDYIDNHEPEEIAKKIEKMLEDRESYVRWKQNTAKVREELIWESEKKVILSLIETIL